MKWTRAVALGLLALAIGIGSIGCGTKPSGEAATSGQRKDVAPGTGASSETQAAAAIPIEQRVGQKVPPFSLTKVDGEKVESTSLGGKAILVDFWATWCPPCHEASKVMQKFHDEFSSAGLVVVGANVDENSAEATRSYVEKNKYTYLMAVDNTRLMEEWGVIGIPFFVLIDEEGVVRAVHDGWSEESERELREAIRSVLGAGR